MKAAGYLIIVILLAGFPGCRSKNQYSSKQPKNAGQPESEQLGVNAVAFHTNDSVTTVFLEVKNENVLYKRPDSTGLFYAQLRVSYRLIFENNARKLVDSSSFVLFDMSRSATVPHKSFYSEFDLDARAGNNYVLHIDVFDVNRRFKYSSLLSVNKLDRLGEQNFLVRRNDSVVFGNALAAGERVQIQYALPLITRLKVSCFFRDFGPALPPFSTKEPDEFKYRPDSIFTLAREGNSFNLSMPPRGFYHLTVDDASERGLTLRTFDPDFPGVGSISQMIDCARYIMSREEFESCKAATDKKAAIDKFWLDIAGSNERARELLRRYYGRVKEANKYYTSYTEGWKSDRGMIFIVFGEPTNIYHSKKDEVWVYGNEANPATLRFVFNKTSNPFSDNDYVMERSQFYKDQWHLAVDFWRQGHVYYDRRR